MIGDDGLGEPDRGEHLGEPLGDVLGEPLGEHLGEGVRFPGKQGAVRDRLSMLVGECLGVGLADF